MKYPGFVFKKSRCKERDMKKWLAGLLTALLLAAFTMPVMASDGIDARLNRQQERINGLADSKEKQRLERDLNQIRERSQELQRKMDRLENDIDQARSQRRELIPGVPIPSYPTPR
jgi:septal ring factor EnvC (AmiA/AmiB activator)